MSGTTYVRLSVSSNMITTSETVVRVTPDSVAAAPTIAYRPGMTQSRSPAQRLNSAFSGWRYSSHCTAMPTMRPARRQRLRTRARAATRTRARADAERRDEDARGQLDPERDDRERALDEHRGADRADDGARLRRRVEDAERGARAARAGAALGEEVVHELGPAHARVRVQEAAERRDERDLEGRVRRVRAVLGLCTDQQNLPDGVRLHPRLLAHIL
jgi:hypothetical protein